MKLSFLLFVIPFLGLIAGVSVAIFKAGVAFGIIRSPLAKQVMTWVFILMPIVLLVTMAIGNFIFSSLNNVFYLISVTWLPILIYLFMGAILLAIIKLIAVSTGNSTINMFPMGIAVIAITAIATGYGIINATMPRVVTYEVNSPELREKWAGKNIVLVSDTHLGVVRSGSFMKKVVSKINEQKPDIVLMAGDIIDGPVFDYEKGLAPLKDIVSTFGTVYTPGNHESYNREPEKFYPIIRNVTTTLLDSTAEINGTIFVGMDYRSESFESTKERLAKTGFMANNNGKNARNDGSPALPSIAILHDPTNTNALLDAGITFVVSGHTHCGQFFPINLLVKRIYKENTYGVVDRTLNADGTASNKTGVSLTTCGVGTAMSPLRLGTNPEIVVIHIK
ncbi:MAG TPA: metallophosphoesterase [Candidatus Paceibacterota bacterium]|nr:metallophosphoesterase [Candidatus Paceibacterota bacterium]